MMQRLKITDGDFLVAVVPQNMNDEAKKAYGDAIAKWLKNRGLDNVQARLCNTGDSYYFQILSVNDIAEAALLGTLNQSSNPSSSEG